MSDIGSQYTDSEIKKLEKRLRSVYSEAASDIEKKLEDFNKRYEAKYQIHLQELKDGKITKQDFDAWVQGQVFQGEQWKAKKDQIAETLYNSNKIATDIINGKMVGVFTTNANFMSYDLEYKAGVDFGFGLYDNATVANMIKNNPDILPFKKMNKTKDKRWNFKKIRNQITQGVVQGENLDTIAKRLAKATSSQNMNAMMTHARTAMTSAQNAGRQISLNDAKNKGIKVKKEWMATLDERTRITHRELDGMKVDIEKPFEVEGYSIMYPGDPHAHPAMVYNCRCTMVGDVVDYPAFYSRRDNVTGQVVNKLGSDTIANLTYKDWQTTRSVINKARMANEIERITDVLNDGANHGHGTINFEVNGHQLTEFKFKGFDSLFRKIVTKSAKKGLTKEQYAKQITDALRFTNVSTPQTLTDDYFRMTDHLESNEFKMVEVTNTFANYDSYRGINTLVRSPEGYVFELQFHTPQSMEIKEINHKLYEEERKLDDIRDVDRKRELIKTQKRNVDRIEMPVGVELIEDIKY